MNYLYEVLDLALRGPSCLFRLALRSYLVALLPRASRFALAFLDALLPWTFCLTLVAFSVALLYRASFFVLASCSRDEYTSTQQALLHSKSAAEYPDSEASSLLIEQWSHDHDPYLRSVHTLRNRLPP